MHWRFAKKIDHDAPTSFAVADTVKLALWTAQVTAVDIVINGFDKPTSVPVTAPPVQPAGGALLVARDKLFPEEADITVIVSFAANGGTLEVVVDGGIVVVIVPLVQVMEETDIVSWKPGDEKLTGYAPAF